jgi:hypothetical protein
MNAQQARIWAILEETAQTATSACDVDMVTQTELLAEGYDLRSLTRDLARIQAS